MPSHDDYNAMLAAHGLGALEAPEVRALETHLQNCAACRQEFAEWEATAATLALDAQPLAPSPQVKQRIIESVRADLARTASEPKAIQAAAHHEPTKLESLSSRQRTSPAMRSWAIAAAFIIAALLASNFLLWSLNKTVTQRVAHLEQQAERAKQQMAQQQEAIEIVSAPGARVSQLAGTKEVPGAHGLVAYDLNGRAMLIVKGLPQPPAGKAYQLWFIAGGKPIPGRVFVTDALGDGTVSDRMPAAALNASGFAITLEPEKGVQAPTGAVYLSSQS